MAFGMGMGSNKQVETAHVATATVQLSKVDAKKAATLRLKQRKKEATAVLIELAKRLGDEKEKQAAGYLEGSIKAMPSGGTRSSTSVLNELLPDVGSKMHEREVFDKTGFGRYEMRQLIKKSIVRERWITFDMKTGEYTLVSIGKEAPADWKGWTAPQAKL